MCTKIHFKTKPREQTQKFGLAATNPTGSKADRMDSVFTAVHRNVVLVDLVDEAWAADHLSDDGVPLMLT